MEIATLFFAGATAIASGSSAYSAYRARHPRRNQTGQIANYTAAHAGYLMADPHRPVPQYMHLIHAPVYNVNYNIAPAPSQSYFYARPSQQQQVPRSQPNRSVSRSQSSNSARPSQQQLVPRSQPNRSVSRSQSSNSARPSQQQLVPRSQPNRSVSRGNQPHGFGGTICLIREQRAPDTYDDHSYGLSTGGRPGYAKINARNHWQSFRRGCNYSGEARTVAVVNWTKGQITMFVERDLTYFRNYLVSDCNVANFGETYQANEIFSGIVKGGELVGSNKPLTIVEDDGDCDVDSSNCWTELGISGPGVRETVFVEMVRGAVFGLICCVHKSPSSMNVDMLSGNGVEFVHVDSDLEYVENSADCCFSVFSFLTEACSRRLNESHRIVCERIALR